MIGRGRRLAGLVFARLPARWRARAKRSLRPAWRGGRRRTRPLSRELGADRGTPIVAWYERGLLQQRAGQLRGRLLAVRTAPDPVPAGVTSVDIVDIDPTNPAATIVADLADPGAVAAGAYDGIVALDVLREASEPLAVVQTLWDGLAPGGVLLISSACVARTAEEATEPDRWRVLPAGLEALVRGVAPEASARVWGMGNAAVGAAAVRGLAAEDLGADTLEVVDEEAPTVALAWVEKPR